MESEESFRSIVGFHVVHLVGRDEAQVLFAVGGESYASVEEHFEIGPHLGEVFGTRNLHQAHQHSHHPRGHTSNGGEGFLVQ